MGYYTRYSLSFDGPPEDLKQVVAAFEAEVKAKNYESWTEAYEGGEPQKWYDHEADMREFSKRYPTITFNLKGEGEEAGDIWISHFKNGLMQRRQGRITFEEMDEKKFS